MIVKHTIIQNDSLGDFHSLSINGVEGQLVSRFEPAFGSCGDRLFMAGTADVYELTPLQYRAGAWETSEDGYSEKWEAQDAK